MITKAPAMTPVVTRAREPPISLSMRMSQRPRFPIRRRPARCSRRRCVCNSFHLRFQFIRAWLAELAFLFERTEHHIVQTRISARFLRRRRKSSDGQFSREHFVKHHAQRVNVRPLVQRPADARVVPAPCTPECQGGRAAGGQRFFRSSFAHEFGDSEIGDFDAAF